MHRRQWENQINRLIRGRVSEKDAEHDSEEVFSQVSNSTNSAVDHHGFALYSRDDQVLLVSPSGHSQHYQRNLRPDVRDFELDNEFEDSPASARTTPMRPRTFDPQSMHLEFDAISAYNSPGSLVKHINGPITAQRKTQSTTLCPTTPLAWLMDSAESAALKVHKVGEPFNF